MQEQEYTKSKKDDKGSWYAPWRDKKTNINNLDEWYAVFVVTGQEDNVKERLDYRFEKSLKIIVPKRKLKERKEGTWREITRVLFPGYVLLKGNFSIEDYYQLKGVPGILKLLRSEYEPLKIREEEIDIINRLTCSGDTIGFSDIFIVNGKVKVVEGPLQNMEGYIVNVDKRKGRAKVRLDFLGEERTIELGVTILQPS